MKFYLNILAGVVLGSLAQAQVVFEGPASGPGRVVQFDDPLALPLLDNIRFLPLEVSGRTELDSLNPSLPQLRADIPGANRILLPDSAGSLYHYQTVREFGQVFGFLMVDASGVGRVVFEFSGYGPEGLLDPLKGFCAIEGSTLWVTSVTEVGGDLFEIDLMAGTAINRTTTLEPLSFLERGLALFPGYGIAMTATGPLRLDRRGGIARVLLFEGQKPAWFAPDIVSSQDESTFAFVAGSSETETHVFYGREGGVIKRASDSPTGLTSAGFAYNTNKGPWLALSTDGSVCAWITQGPSRELFVRELEAIDTTPEFQVTHDQRFTDTLNDSGVIAFFSPESLVCLVGDESGNEARPIESGDFYRVDVRPGMTTETQTDILNLSGTSGDVVLPFLSYGTLSNAGGIYRVPGFDGLLAMDEEAQTVVAVDWDGNVLTLVDGAETINSLHRVGEEAVINVQMSAPIEADEYQALFRLAPLAGLVSPIAALPPGGQFESPATYDAEGWGFFAAIANVGRGVEHLGRYTVPTEAMHLALPVAANYGPTQCFTPNGELMFTVELPGQTYFVEWSAFGLRLLGQHARGFLLPGL